MRRILPLASLALALALVACSPEPVERTTPTATPGAIPWKAYVCEDGRVVRASYPDRTSAQLSLDGERFQMTLARSASGARYVGPGLQWWTKGEEGMLARLAAGEEIAADPGQRCLPPAKVPLTPPTPGTPGGLPDDRTPLVESSPRLDSGQAAARVLETYFVLVESGKTEAAAKLRTDGVAEDLTPYASLGAQLGRPGPVEGAAGSLFVEIPVSVYGRYVNGEAYVKGGKAVLRRVNDVPGSTPAQRSWRIEKFDLETASVSPPTR